MATPMYRRQRSPLSSLILRWRRALGFLPMPRAQISRGNGLTGMLLFRRLQAGAVDPFVEILDHAFMARTGRRRGVLWRVRKLDILLHRLSPFPLGYPVLAGPGINKLLVFVLLFYRFWCDA